MCADQYLEDHVLPPHEKYLDTYPDMKMMAPFEVKLKNMQNAYELGTVLESVIPKLSHGNDGLIFTSCDAEYSIGTDYNMCVFSDQS